MEYRPFNPPVWLYRAYAIVLTVSLVLCLVGCTEDKRADTGKKDAAPVEAAKKVLVQSLRTMDMVDRRSYAANLEASTEITLYPLVAERIVSFPVEEGDRVEAGQVVARIRAASIKKSIAQMQAEIESLDQTIGSQKRELERSAGLYDKAVIT
jgi:multidrug efflux pump subunit AcrA (membrane-fusion protein)